MQNNNKTWKNETLLVTRHVLQNQNWMPMVMKYENLERHKLT